ncbi:MAG: CotH kinase family protein [Bacteroidaceae bacterium]|nr:CotH kinase family protein [Bacteroidaceae bacterium]
MTAIMMVCPSVAQNWYKINTHSDTKYDFVWSFPYEISQFPYSDFSSDGHFFRISAEEINEASSINVPYAISMIDSVTFVDEVSEDLQSHNKYQVYTLSVTTKDFVGVNSREEYVDCVVSLDGKDGYNWYSGSGSIRGRGNSTWSIYPKKPYRIKLNDKHKMLGLAKAKSWVLLANYRDLTSMMNTYVFEVARWMGMPYVNHTRFVELFVDGEYEGLYQLTEQVQQGKNRVDVSENEGILLSMDKDDGPELSPESTDNFWSTVYNMPMCVKYPDDVDEQTKDSIRMVFAELENAIKAVDYEMLDSLMDMKSFMTMAMIQELVENVEICAPRSIFMYKDGNGKWAMGPFWDWDAGFDFDWGTFYDGNIFRYFGDYHELVLGTDPANRKGMYGATPRFFTDMFKSDSYTREYKELWNSVKDSIVTRNWEIVEQYVNELNKGAYARNKMRWPIVENTGWGGWGHSTTYDVNQELSKMKTWLDNRVTYLDQIINAYPQTGTEGAEEEMDYGILNTYVSGTNMDIYLLLNMADGYSQSANIEISPSTLAEMLGLSDNEFSNATIKLSALNSNGKEGGHTAQGTWGAWFDDKGNVVDYGGNSHVFIEPRNLATSDVYSWNYGCHPNNCQKGDQHVATMRYAITQKRQTSYITVTVHFGIDCIPEGTYDNINVDPSLYSWRNMQKVGEEIITKSYDMSSVEAYSKQPISINLNEIVAKFPQGATVDNLKYMTCIDIKTGELTSNLTSSNGFYMMFDGTATSWGSSECKVGYNPGASTLDFAYTSDLMAPVSGSKCTASVFLVFDDRYYYRFIMNITLN